MIAGLKPYPAYKDSGVEWLSEVPEGWKVMPVKRVAMINPRKSELSVTRRRGTPVTFLPMEKVASDGTFDSGEAVPIDDVWDGFTYFRRSDVIVAKITPCFENGKGASLEHLPTDIGFGSTEFIVLRPSGVVLSRYLSSLVSLPSFRRLGADSMQGAGGQQRVSTEFVASFSFPIPPIDQQDAVIRFLAHVDFRIQRFITMKERQVELLREEEQAAIHHAITRGLDSGIAIRPSGVDSIGDMPAHWTLTRVKNEFRSLDHVRRPIAAPDRELKKGPYDYYGASGVIDKVDAYLFDEDLLLIAEDGANLVLRNSPLAIVARGRYWVNNHAHILKPVTGQLDFMAMLMESFDYRPYISGAAQPKLTQDRLFSMPIVVPPVAEQEEIIERLDSVNAPVERTIGIARRQIDLLHEYRTRLISDVVTGQLDVREAAKNIPSDPDTDDPVLDEKLEEVAAT